MRKALIVMLLLGMACCPAFAQVASEATGVVDSINPIDPDRGDYEGGIILKDTDSNVKSFNIIMTTVISDAASGKIASGDIRDGDKVRVTYSGSSPVPSAITILRLDNRK